MKAKHLIITVLTALSVFEASASEIWRNPTIFRINKEKAHAEFTVYENRADALQPLNLENPWHSKFYRSLNGEWDFNWYGSVPEVPADWNQPESAVKKWDTIPVPGCWQTAGYDRFYYLNIYIPYEFDWSTGERAPGFRDGEIELSKTTGFIPDNMQRVGCYRKWVDLSDEDLNKRVLLRIGAVEAGVQLYVNGCEVGYSQDSLTPAEFDISRWAKPGKNLIALKVFRWTDGSYMEVQDMIRFAGIYRDVFLKFEPKQRIRDIHFTGTPDASLKKVNATYAVEVHNDTTADVTKAKLHFELLENGASRPVKTWAEKIDTIPTHGHVDITGELTLKKMKLWSPDLPNLYTLLVSLETDDGNTEQIARIDTGFRRFEDRNGNLHLNGKRFHIRGVNRHDHHPVYGRHVPLENMVRDIELMKQNNINTVRTSHYPNDERWAYLCNRYGMALIDEANVESHAFADVPGNRPQWTAAAVDRIQNMIERDKNHPAILIWSLGNEQGWGWTTAFEAQYNRAKEIDPSRIVMCDRANRQDEKHPEFNSKPSLEKPDTITPMYRALSNMDKYLANRANDPRPFFMCEYRHAMGNSVGALKEVWDQIYANEENGLNGGCIWDWIDQGVEARAEDGTRYYQYGGDWGDKYSFRNFCLNGLIMSDQRTTDKLAEVKKCYEPFTMKAVDANKGLFTVLNRLNQRALDQFLLKWEVRTNGRVVQSGTLNSLTARPRETQTFTVPFDAAALSTGQENILRLSYQLKTDTRWAKAGHEVCFSEFDLKGTYEPLFTKKGPAPTVNQAKGAITVAANGTRIRFDKTSGQLTSLKAGDTELLTSSPRERLFDHSLAWIDNLVARNRKNQPPRIAAYWKQDLDNLQRQGQAKVEVTEAKGAVVVTIKNTFMSPKKAGFDETQTWTIYGSGAIELAESVKAAGKLKEDEWIARIGLRLPLKPSINRMAYYGLGPHGNYPDRSYGAWTGIHKSTVMDSYIPYPKPQDHGNREQVRWMVLADQAGNGLKVLAPKPLSMSALPYTQDELFAAKHTIDLPKQPTTTELRIAAKVSGIGNGSCGPLTDEQYQTKATPTEYRVIFMPFAAKK